MYIVSLEIQKWIEDVGKAPTNMLALILINTSLNYAFYLIIGYNSKNILQRWEPK